MLTGTIDSMRWMTKDRPGLALTLVGAQIAPPPVMVLVAIEKLPHVAHGVMIQCWLVIFYIQMAVLDRHWPQIENENGWQLEWYVVSVGMMVVTSPDPPQPEIRDAHLLDGGTNTAN